MQWFQEIVRAGMGKVETGLSFYNKAVTEQINDQLKFWSRSESWQFFLTLICQIVLNKMKTRPCNEARGFLNPFTPKISLAILLTVCNTVLMLLI